MVCRRQPSPKQCNRPDEVGKRWHLWSSTCGEFSQTMLTTMIEGSLGLVGGDEAWRHRRWCSTKQSKSGSKNGVGKEKEGKGMEGWRRPDVMCLF